MKSLTNSVRYLTHSTYTLTHINSAYKAINPNRSSD